MLLAISSQRFFAVDRGRILDDVLPMTTLDDLSYCYLAKGTTGNTSLEGACLKPAGWCVVV